MTFTLTFNEAVNVTGNPTLTLNDGGTASYLSGSGGKTLVFTYTVANGDNASSLALTGVGPSSAGTVTDASGNTASLLGALAAPRGHLIVDTADARTAVSNGQTLTVSSSNTVAVLPSGTANITFASGTSNDVAFLGGSGPTNATITDASSGLTVYVLNAGTDVFNGFGNDPAGVVDLLGGVGGYTSIAAVLRSLTTDGNGGTKLPLGGSQSIDFANTPLGKLTAVNFRIG